ncbi:TPA: tape measure protein [Neisseria weaveri]
MSNLEAKIKITAENQAAQGLNAAAAGTQQAADKIGAAGKQAQSAFQQAMGQIESLLKEVNTSIKTGFDRMAENISDGVKKADSEIDKLSGGIGKLGTLLAGFATVSFAQDIARTADAMQSLNNQIKQVTASEREYTAVKAELLAVSNRTYSEIEATTDLFVKTSRAMKDYGYTSQEVIKFTEATANAMTIGGVGAQQQAAAIMQLSQALGSGVLQGDEFKSIAEAAPILLDTIAEYMGKSRAEIKKLGSDGKLTAEVVFNAISGASEKFAEQAAKMPATLGQSLTVFQNNWKAFTDGLLNSTGVMSGLAAVVKLIADNLNFIVPVIAGLTASIIAVTAPTLAATAAAWGLNAALLANPIGLVVAGIGLAIAAFNEFGDEIDIFGDGLSNLHDVARATFDIISESVSEMATTAKAVFEELTGFISDSIGDWSAVFDDVLSFIASIIKTYINAYVNTFATGWMLIKEAAGNMPQFFANLGAAIANVFLSAIEGMINRAIGLINSLIGMANKAAALVGASGIDTIGKASVGRLNDGGLGGRIAESMTKDRAGAFVDKVRSRAGRLAGDRVINDSASFAHGGGSGVGRPAAGGGGSGGRKGGKGGGSGRETDPMQLWEAQIKAQKLAHEEMRIAGKTHDEWDKNREREFWQAKLSMIDANSKTGLKIREKILALHKELEKQTTEAKMSEIAEREKIALHALNLEADKYDHALAMGQIKQRERLDAEIEFEQKRYEIAFQAMQERIALAEADPFYGKQATDRLKQQAAELTRSHERKQGQNHDKRDQHERKENPTFTDMLQDGGKNMWQEAQNHMSQAFTAMLTRTQNFHTAMNNFFKSMGQTFIQEMVTKPLMGMMRRMVQESAIYQMIFGKKQALEAASAASTVATKTSETTAVVGQNAIQAASGAASSQASIPYVGPVLAIAAMGAMMAAVMGLMGGGGSSTTTTTTRIPSAANGWDIPAGINPLTQLHENEMVLPAEQAQVIRDMAGGGGGETIVINTTGGDFIHKKDLAKLLKQMKRDFKFTS